jgi:hypothetical protein
MAKGGKRPGSGRPAGVPNKATAEVREAARQYGKKAVKELAKLAGLVDEGAGKAESDQARIAALNGILDRGYGKPSQHIGGDAENPIEAVVQIITGVPRAKG